MSKATLTIDPDPCHEYPWLGDCPECYSHAHYCELGAGHTGACRCGNCGTTATSHASSCVTYDAHIVAANAEMGEALTLVGRALDAIGAPPGDSMVARVEAMGDLMAESLAVAVENADTHRALDEIGAPPGTSPAERLRATAAMLQPVVDGMRVAEKRLLQAANDLAAALGEDAPDTALLGSFGLSLVVAGLAARVRGGAS